MQKSLGALALSIIALAGSPAYASTANGVLTVQATVLAACSVNSGTLAFGVINPATGTGTLTNTNV
ncbi:MAG: hypothetical protein OSB00_18250, partial [Sphingomonas bacterium]|nr:hypothetical protein [Sphingomonas bacterium]